MSSDVMPIKTRINISQSLVGKPKTKEHKENIRQGLIGLKKSTSHKKKISESIKQSWLRRKEQKNTE